MQSTTCKYSSCHLNLEPKKFLAQHDSSILNPKACQTTCTSSSSFFKSGDDARSGLWMPDGLMSLVGHRIGTSSRFKEDGCRLVRLPSLGFGCPMVSCRWLAIGLAPAVGLKRRAVDWFGYLPPIPVVGLGRAGKRIWSDVMLKEISWSKFRFLNWIMKRFFAVSVHVTWLKSMSFGARLCLLRWRSSAKCTRTMRWSALSSFV